MERPGSNGSCPGCRLEGGPAAGAATGLAAVLIFTIVVDVLGNALVILSVLRNKKLRNAEAAANGGTNSGKTHVPSAEPRWEERGRGADHTCLGCSDNTASLCVGK